MRVPCGFVTVFIVCATTTMLTLAAESCFADRYGGVLDEMRLEEQLAKCRADPRCWALVQRREAQEAAEQRQRELQDQALKESDPFAYYATVLGRIVLGVLLIAGIIGAYTFFFSLGTLRRRAEAGGNEALPAATEGRDIKRATTLPEQARETREEFSAAKVGDGEPPSLDRLARQHIADILNEMDARPTRPSFRTTNTHIADQELSACGLPADVVRRPEVWEPDVPGWGTDPRSDSGSGAQPKSKKPFASAHSRDSFLVIDGRAPVYLVPLPGGKEKLEQKPPAQKPTEPPKQ